MHVSVLTAVFRIATCITHNHLLPCPTAGTGWCSLFHCGIRGRGAADASIRVHVFPDVLAAASPAAARRPTTAQSRAYYAWAEIARQGIEQWVCKL